MLFEPPSTMKIAKGNEFDTPAYITPSPARPFVELPSNSFASDQYPSSNTESSSNAPIQELCIGLEYDDLNAVNESIQRSNFIQFQGQRRIQVESRPDTTCARLVCEYHPWCKFYILLNQIPETLRYRICELDLGHHPQCDSLLHDPFASISSGCAPNVSFESRMGTPAHLHSVLKEKESEKKYKSTQLEVSGARQQPIEQQHISPVGTTLIREDRSDSDHTFVNSLETHAEVFKNQLASSYPLHAINPNGMYTEATGMQEQAQYQKFNKARPLIVQESPSSAFGNPRAAFGVHANYMATPVAPRTPVTVIRQSDSLNAYTLSTDMRWDTAKEAARAIYNFASQVQNKRTRMDKKSSGGRNKKYVCVCAHCDWCVRLLKVLKTEQWKISSMQLQHSVDCEAVYPNANSSAPSLQLVVQTPSSVPLTPGVGVSQSQDISAITTSDDPCSKSFGTLLQTFLDQYPESVVAIKSNDQQKTLSNVCIVASWARNALPFLQNVYGVEVIACSAPKTLEKSASRFGGRYFIAVIGKDGNLEPRLIALGFVKSLSEENINWFTQELESAGFLMNGTTVFIGYGQQSVADGLQRIFPQVRLQYCTDSLLAAIESNIIPSLPSELTITLREQIIGARTASNVAIFQDYLSSIASISSSAASFLQQLNPTHWALFANLGIRTYNWTSNCFSEYLQSHSLSHQSAEHMEKTPFLTQETLPLLDTYEIVKRFLSDACDRHVTRFPILQQIQQEQNEFMSTVAMEMPQNRVNPHIMARTLQLTPNGTLLVENEILQSTGYQIQSVDSVVAFVYPQSEHESPNRVNLRDLTCSCAFTFQMGLPCRHIVATARAMGSMPSIRQAVEHIYMIGSYRSACLSQNQSVTEASRSSNKSGDRDTGERGDSDSETEDFEGDKTKCVVSSENSEKNKSKKRNLEDNDGSNTVEGAAIEQSSNKCLKIGALGLAYEQCDERDHDVLAQNNHEEDRDGVIL
uniref:AlNc14C18G1895 protein n=1 Tax=Albugo laibachii Nc14 TaxID=890382 RepID=F0W4S7_9STRA|nr:AlNc14C18G1895 [Albugo laibachii Nc14]|eukprot:CCA16113.1 AlNc14C18G1895 [Albugo laibachii Nc14]